MIKKIKTTPIVFITIIAFLSTACSSVKKSAAAPATPPPVSSNPVSPDPFWMAKPANGAHIPGDEDLLAIRLQYKEVTLDQLKEGHSIYTQGACTNCHGAQSIYDHSETQWKIIMDDMAQRAQISDTQKDAVYKYVLAIKATQPK